MHNTMTIKQLSIGNRLKQCQDKKYSMVFAVACCVLLSNQANAVNMTYNIDAYRLGNVTYTINDSNAEWINPQIVSAVSHSDMVHPNKEGIKKEGIKKNMVNIGDEKLIDNRKLIDSSWEKLHDVHIIQGSNNDVNFTQSILTFHYNSQRSKNLEFDLNVNGHLIQRNENVNGHLNKHYKIEPSVSFNLKFKWQ